MYTYIPGFGPRRLPPVRYGEVSLRVGLLEDVSPHTKGILQHASQTSCINSQTYVNVQQLRIESFPLITDCTSPTCITPPGWAHPAAKSRQVLGPGRLEHQRPDAQNSHGRRPRHAGGPLAPRRRRSRSVEKGVAVAKGAVSMRGFSAQGSRLSHSFSVHRSICATPSTRHPPMLVLSMIMRSAEATRTRA